MNADRIVLSFYAYIFLLSFFTKSVNQSSIQWEIASYRIVPNPLLKVTAALVLTIEIFLFLGFMIDPLIDIAVFTAMAVLLAFSLLTLGRRIRNGDRSCSCFGNHRWLNKFPLTRNLILFLGLCVERVLPHQTLGWETSVSLSLVVASCVFFTEGLMKRKRLAKRSISP